MRLKKFLIFTFVIINFVGINQSYSIEPDVFVQSTVNRASEALNNEYSKEEKIEKLKQIASVRPLVPSPIPPAKGWGWMLPIPSNMVRPGSRVQSHTGGISVYSEDPIRM